MGEPEGCSELQTSRQTRNVNPREITLVFISCLVNKTNHLEDIPQPPVGRKFNALTCLRRETHVTIHNKLSSFGLRSHLGL